MHAYLAFGNWHVAIDPVDDRAYWFRASSLQECSLAEVDAYKAQAANLFCKPLQRGDIVTVTGFPDERFRVGGRSNSGVYRLKSLREGMEISRARSKITPLVSSLATEVSFATNNDGGNSRELNEPNEPTMRNEPTRHKERDERHDQDEHTALGAPAEQVEHAAPNEQSKPHVLISQCLIPSPSGNAINAETGTHGGYTRGQYVKVAGLADGEHMLNGPFHVHWRDNRTGKYVVIDPVTDKPHRFGEEELTLCNSLEIQLYEALKANSPYPPLSKGARVTIKGSKTVYEVMGKRETGSYRLRALSGGKVVSYNKRENLILVLMSQTDSMSPLLEIPHQVAIVKDLGR